MVREAVLAMQKSVVDQSVHDPLHVGCAISFCDDLGRAVYTRLRFFFGPIWLLITDVDSRVDVHGARLARRASRSSLIKLVLSGVISTTRKGPVSQAAACRSGLRSAWGRRESKEEHIPLPGRWPPYFAG
eukprot:jgi/Botrbrau1/8249/Bobra.0001s0007.1